jgi:hypothetical protein
MHCRGGDWLSEANLESMPIRSPSSGLFSRPITADCGYSALHEAKVPFLSAALRSFKPPMVSPSTMI